MTETTVKLYGTVKKRVEENGIIHFETTEAILEEEFSDASEFDAFVRRSPDTMAENSLPENFFVPKSRQSSFDVTVDLNAVEAREWAENIADNDERTIVDILTRWLQVFGSMRVRRALHTYLDEQGVQVQRVD